MRYIGVRSNVAMFVYSINSYLTWLFIIFQILDTVAEIQERHDAVRDLERKLLELQQVIPLVFSLA